jgi:hypothetical protein
MWQVVFLRFDAQKSCSHLIPSPLHLISSHLISSQLSLYFLMRWGLGAVGTQYPSLLGNGHSFTCVDIFYSDPSRDFNSEMAEESPMSIGGSSSTTGSGGNVSPGLQGPVNYGSGSLDFRGGMSPNSPVINNFSSSNSATQYRLLRSGERSKMIEC